MTPSFLLMRGIRRNREPMALTAEQIRASLEAKKKKLLSGGEKQNTEAETRKAVHSDRLADTSEIPLPDGKIIPAQNNLPALVLADADIETSDGVDQDGEARESTLPESGKSKDGRSSRDADSDSRGGQKRGAVLADSAGSTPAPRTIAPRGTKPEVPQAPEIETAVLAALYQYPATCFPTFNERARPEFFFSPVNRSFFERLSDYFTEHGQADPQSFLQSLLDSGQLERHGGTAFLSSLLTAASPPSALEYHLDILRDKFVAREAFRLSSALAESIGKASESELFPLMAAHQTALAELTSSLAARNGHLSFRRISEIFAMTFDDTDNYFGDRVMAAGQPCTLLGPGDIGKSRLSLQLALSMITGRDFLSMPTHACNKKWLFIQSENSCRRLYADLKNMLSGLGLSKHELAQVEEHLLIHTLENDYDSFLSLEDDKIYAKVNDLIQKVKPDIIDWDPLNSLTDEDLNADVDMRKVCMKISRVTKQGDISRVPFVVHHALTGKTGAAKAVGWEKSSYGRNSKVLHAWTRAQINLAPRSPDDSTLLIMSCGKNNNGKAFPEVGVQFNEETGIYAIDQTFDPADFREQVGIAASSKRIFSPRMILDFRWPAELLEKKSLVKAFTDESGCGRSRAYELVEEAKKRG